ncbi:ectoine hydroxylase-related dioxygenase (phytanoyl-CoA dioxygenase family) [Mycobacterium frederiksbergense]|uniref:Ectoine hydroxylase-related dioxygenase (Phytanoyl-CoA dioxygenase family) n=1 Tax=Mycolicibacterium frederiksbergense TaxID=117567 RepID=A0ABT6L1I1_9MYCO|nr:phytanoyl-CoA dioxygenase family protein [Mycolicibacterium frederiksbergense]MDH6196067.1 ectoine hydroxylase-related dioxygenase (phytanoyl-CoA dioxygenase family) [Mycolicibacterium frederiksbergense]
MSLVRMLATAPLDDILGVVDRDGGLIVEGLFPVETIAALRTAVLQAASSHQPGAATQGLGDDAKDFVGAQTIRFASLGKISESYFDLLDNDVFASIADAVLLPYCGSYWVNTGQAMLIGPGNKAQTLHRDCDNWPVVAATVWPSSPEVTFSAMIALDTVTEELGATRVIPGSHKWSEYWDRGDQSNAYPAEMEPGDALVYTGKVVHGGGANRTSSNWRLAAHLSFVVGWLTPEECSPLDYTGAELAGRSPRIQRLLGHRSYDPRPHLGGGLWLRNVNPIESQQPKTTSGHLGATRVDSSSSAQQGDPA